MGETSVSRLGGEWSEYPVVTLNNLKTEQKYSDTTDGLGSEDKSINV